MPKQTSVTRVTVKYVNQPKSTNPDYGSIVDGNRNYFGVPADLIGNFQAGRTYEIHYTENEKNGKIYKNFSHFATGATHTEAATQTNGGAGEVRTTVTNADTTFEDHKNTMIFVTGVVGRAMGSGSFVATDIDKLTEMAMAAYQKYLSV